MGILCVCLYISVDIFTWYLDFLILCNPCIAWKCKQHENSNSEGIIELIERFAHFTLCEYIQISACVKI